MTRRRVLVALSAIAVVVLLVGGGAVAFRLPLAEAVLRRGLAAEGIERASFTIAELGLHGARLTSIALGREDEAEVADLRLTYTPESLLAGRVDSVAVDSLRLKLDLTGRAPPLGSLQGLLAATGGPAVGAAPQYPLVRLKDARIAAATPAGALTATLSGEVAPLGDGRLRAALDVALAAALGARVTGKLTAEGDPGGDLSGALSVSDGALTLAATEAAGAQGEIRFRLQALRPVSLAGHLALGQLMLEGTDVPGAALEVSATPERAEITARASSGNGDLDAELNAEIADLTAAPRLQASARASANLAAALFAPLWSKAGAPRPEGGRAALKLRLRAALPAERPWQLSRAELDADLDLAKIAAAGATVSSAQLHLPLTVTLQAAQTALHLRGNGRFEIAGTGLQLGTSRLRAAGPLAGDIAALDALFPRAPGTAAPKVVVALRPKPLTLEVARAGATAQRLEIAADRIGAAYEADQAGTPALRLSVAGGKVTAPDPAVAIEGLALDAELAPNLALRRAAFSVDALRHLAEPPIVAPWSLSGTLTAKGDRLALQATAKGPKGQGRITATGALRPAEGGGTIALSLAPLTFAAAGPTPATFVPALADVRDARGTISATADLAWGAEKPSARARLTLDHLAFAAPGARVSGLTLDLDFDSLYPPATPPDQTLQIARLDPGVPLSDLDLHFRILPGTPPKLAIGSGKVAVIGGELSLADVTLDPAATRVAVPVTARHLDLAALFKQLDVEGLAGEGHLSGRIPLVFSGAALAVEGGHLAADGPGTLRIHSDAARRLLGGGGESTDLVLNALEDFRYSELTLDINKAFAADPRLTLSILGHNPAVYEGYPIRLNVNVEGRTGRLLDALSQAYRLSNSLLRRLWRPR